MAAPANASKTWFGLGAAFALVAAPAFADNAPQPASKWTPWIEFGGFYGTDNTSRAEAVLWVPLAQGNTSVLFGEARGKLFEDDMREGNFALGYRQMMPGGWNLGVWGGYDIRESQFGTTFHQAAGGIEALSDRWDFRANAYLPFDDSEHLVTTTTFATQTAVELSANQIGMVTTVTSNTSRLDELALWGLDAEIGTKLFATPEDLAGPRHELRLYAGAFHFDHSDLAESVTGPRVRAEWRVDEVLDQWSGSRLTFEAEYSHDNLRDNRVELGARLRLPFGDQDTRSASRTLSAQERRMTEGLERDTDIVTGTATSLSSSIVSKATEAVEDAKTGVRFDRVAMADATNDVTTTATAAGANSLIIATGSISGAQSIAADQTLQGGSSTIMVRGVISGTVLDFTAPGARPTLTNTANSAVLTVGGSNTHIAGIDVVGPGQIMGHILDYGIEVTSQKTNVHIDAVNVSATGQASIYINDSNSVSISNAVLTGPWGHGVYVGLNNTVEISNTEIVATAGSGVFGVFGNHITITDTEIRNSASNGIGLSSGNTLHALRVTIDNADGNGIVSTAGNNDLTVNDTHLKGKIGGPLNSGIRINGPNNTLAGTGNTVAPGTVFGGAGFCNIVGAATGSITFDIGTCP